MISAIDVTKSYKVKNGTIIALSGVSLHIKAGEFVAVIGRSGSGKSTLLGVMSGLLKPTSGEVLLDGESVWELDERARAQLRAQKHGFVFQNASVIPSLTVLENVALPQIFLPQPSVTDISRATNLIELVGLGSRLNAYPDQLSGGEKRRVAIASALMNDPPLLFADEPTGDLDSQTESEIMGLFLSLWRGGKTIVMITHNSQLASYASRILEMDGGFVRELSGHNRAEAPSDYESNPLCDVQSNMGDTPGL